MNTPNCIEHTQKGNKQGYGGATYKGQWISLHRLAYCEHNSVTIESIKGLVVRHTCDNPRCINPEHLLIGTLQDNIDDRTKRGRHRNGLRNNGQTKLTEEQVLWIRTVYIPRHKEFGCRALAQKFAISPATISLLMSDKTWKDVK